MLHSRLQRNKSVYRLDSRPSSRVRGSGFARLGNAVRSSEGEYYIIVHGYLVSFPDLNPHGKRSGDFQQHSRASSLAAVRVHDSFHKFDRRCKRYSKYSQCSVVQAWRFIGICSLVYSCTQNSVLYTNVVHAHVPLLAVNSTPYQGQWKNGGFSP